MQKINRLAALETAKTCGIILALFGMISAVFYYIPFPIIITGLALASVAGVIKCMYDYNVWKLEKDEM